MTIALTDEDAFNKRDVDEWLAHHGVMGMHWGKHLPGKTEASHNPKPVKRPAHSDHVESRQLLQKKVHELSTPEIKKLNDRLQSEQKLSQLNPSSISKGKKITLGIIAAAGTAATVYNLINSPAGKAGIAAGKKAVEKLILKMA